MNRIVTATLLVAATLLFALVEKKAGSRIGLRAEGVLEEDNSLVYSIDDVIYDEGRPGERRLDGKGGKGCKGKGVKGKSDKGGKSCKSEKGGKSAK